MMLRISLATAALVFMIPQTGRTEIVDGLIGVNREAIGSFGDYRFDVRNQPASTSPTSVWMDFSYNLANLQLTLTGRDSYLDWGSDWYFVRGGDRFDLDAISLSSYPLIIGMDEVGAISMNAVSFSPAFDAVQGLEDGADDFYLGVATGIGGPRSVFGWVKLKFTLFGVPELDRLEYLDSAVSFGEGIIVGTRTAVPEPALASIAISLIASIAAGRARSNRSFLEPR